MAVTLRDVAREAGVSFKTVSNVVNEYPHVRAATRQRVLDAMGRLDYKPNYAARSLRLGRTGLIGLAIPEVSLPYFSALSAEVIEAAGRHGLVVVTEQTNRTREGEIEALTSPRRQMTDGLIFSPIALRSEDAGMLRASGPLVLLGESVFTDTADHVTMQNVQAARAATEYLISLGHRRIAVIGAHPGEVLGSSGLRLTGYREALAHADIPFDPGLLGEAELWHRLEGADAMRRVLERGPVDAVFAFNDTLAFGAMHALQERRIRIPEDVSVIGFDDTEEGQYSLPTLTTIDPGRRRIADLAVDTLVERIEDPSRATRLVEVDFRLIIRASTRPTPRSQQS
jgi:DNA-binding LacI/PurR family transcriptional regulator